MDGGEPGGWKSMAKKLAETFGKTVTNWSKDDFQSIIVPPKDLFLIKGSSVSKISSELRLWQ